MTSELDALDPVPETVKLTSGTVVQLEDLRARQFFKLLRIITHGALPALRDTNILKLDADTNATEYGTRLLSVIVLAIPDAEDQTIEFIASMVKPAGLVERRGLNKQDAERNTELWAVLDRELVTPDLDDLLTLIEAIVRRESADIQALGKRLAAMFKLAQKTGQLPASLTPTSPTPTSSAGSPDASTSLPPSTDGATTPSPTSPSDDSASASPPSGNVASTRGGRKNSG